MMQKISDRLKESVTGILHKSLRLLILDDQSLARETLENFFYDLPIYHTCAAATQRQALRYIENEGPFHCCLYDLSVTDIENDQFYLLKRFCRQTSFIVVTGSRSPRAGGESRDLGAKEILEKSTLIKSLARQVVNRWTIINILYPEFDSRTESPFSRAVKTLFARNPRNVDEWVRELNVDDSAFRKMWRNRDIHPKHALEIYNLLLSAARAHDEEHHWNESEQREFEAHIGYFLTHRNTLIKIIRKNG